MSGDARDFNNIETRAVIKFFFSARQGAEGNSRQFLVGLRTYQHPFVSYAWGWRSFNMHSRCCERITLKFHFLQDPKLWDGWTACASTTETLLLETVLPFVP